MFSKGRRRARSFRAILPAVASILLLAAITAGPAAAGSAGGRRFSDEAEREAYLRGYIEAGLVHGHGIGPAKISVTVDGGVVTLAGTRVAGDRLEAAIDWIKDLPGVSEVNLAIETKQAVVRFPVGDVFLPPLAFPKEPRSHATWQYFETAFGNFNIGSVAFGDTFGLAKWPGRKQGNGWQLSISGGVFALFNLDSASQDLLNADYVVGFPLSASKKPWSGRLRLYHQSSHLGDEFLLNPQPVPPVRRINLSYEALEFLGSFEGKKGFRLYGGGTKIFSSDTPLRRSIFQFGAEYRSRPFFPHRSSFLAGLDVQAWEEVSWSPDYSVKAGLAFPTGARPGRTGTLLLEYYKGQVPHGQFFFDIEVDYFGIGGSLGF